MRLTSRRRRTSWGSRSGWSTWGSLNSRCTWGFLNTRSAWRSRSSRDTRGGVKCLGRILGLDRQSRREQTARLVGLDVNFELSFAGFRYFGLKFRTRRGDLDIFHAKILPGVDRDRLRVGLFALFPKHKSRTDL